MTRTTLHIMPVLTSSGLVELLNAGWTIFQHRQQWWASTVNPATGTRLMSRVADWQVAYAIRTHHASRSGVRLVPTFNHLHRRYAA